MSRWRSVSTPSATTFRPSACASLITASTMARASALRLEVDHEAAVDLQLARPAAGAGSSGSSSRCRSRRSTGACPMRAEALEGALRGLRVFHRHRLGDLAGQQRRVDAVARRARRRCASTRSSWRSWCTDRLIATRMRRPLVAPLADLPARLVDDPVAERADQAEALGQRDEHVGPIRPRTGWCQRISASRAVTCRSRAWILGW